MFSYFVDLASCFSTLFFLNVEGGDAFFPVSTILWVRSSLLSSAVANLLLLLVLVSSESLSLDFAEVVCYLFAFVAVVMGPLLSNFKRSDTFLFMSTFPNSSELCDCNSLKSCWSGFLRPLVCEKVGAELKFASCTALFWFLFSLLRSSLG